MYEKAKADVAERWGAVAALTIGLDMVMSLWGDGSGWGQRNVGAGTVGVFVRMSCIVDSKELRVRPENSV